ncbi:DNA-binding SARP family transcriptional activator [Kitasatospora sp. MAP12-15]|uniref:BTAD domain-containing putative transcriptional regulator n=1 Tax=unclassified Kitasatospora TaxID=2633591 RepID=UPI002475DEBF|nr:BTAD domain-containing putative transcriptional regulator [Kitasatospora sp. MAP12-44]MDH6113767.1 DNA-binding SARP family transcriptional activator [Kitasatospora sp. MAP12-44]
MNPPAPSEPSPRFRVLGPLEVTGGDGARLPLSGIRQRAVLGLLLLHANRVVATSDLVKALWPHHAPPTARKVLQNAVSALRATLAAGDIGTAHAELLSRAPGYLLRLDPDGVDLSHFRRLAQQGQAELAAGSPESAARLLREALALWRGSALQDLQESGVRWPELAGLQSARMTTWEDCFEALLASGRHHEAAWELEVAVDLDPTRERMCGLLMLALYRCGRQVDALTVYRRHRSRLLDQLGLEPGRTLRSLEQAILNQDPALDLSGTGPAARTPAVAFRPVASPVRTSVRTGAPPGTSPPAAAPPVSLVDRGPELEMLRSVLRLTQRRREPHLVTILGAPGSGKSRLISEFRSMLRKDEGAVRCLVGRTPPPSVGQGLAALAEIVRSPAGAARRGGLGADAGPGSESLAAYRGALQQMAAVRPLVAVLDDVHWDNGVLLDFLDDVVSTTSSVPLLLVVAARPELLEVRPAWGGGRSRTTTITLDAPPARPADTALHGSGIGLT